MEQPSHENTGEGRPRKNETYKAQSTKHTTRKARKTRRHEDTKTRRRKRRTRRRTTKTAEHRHTKYKHKRKDAMLKIHSPLPEDVEQLMHDTIGCCIAVHRELGPGLRERIYSRAVCIE